MNGNDNILNGKLVRLVVADPTRDSKLIHDWNNNSLFQHLANGGPALLYSPAGVNDWLNKDQNNPDSYHFMIETVADGKIIGDIGLDGFERVSGNAWVGIAIGEPENWGKGYGTEAMQIILRFGFTVLNLHRVSLTVFDFNQRGIRSYQKAGFRHEGSAKGAIHRNGQRFDMNFMGILRSDWDVLQYIDEDQADQKVSAMLEN
jgi:RimJ/RimL family protein N-acetyltransferase